MKQEFKGAVGNTAPFPCGNGAQRHSIALAPRLRMVAGLVPRGARVADVGTDHAYLPVWLVQNGVAPKVIACDLRPGPLGTAQDTVRRYGLEGQIDLRLGDGLACVAQDEVDAVVIAGMGGETIAGILAQAPWAKDCLCVLQPMTKQAALRSWLIEQGYRIAEEQICREGDALYAALAATGGVSVPYTPAELHAGPQTAGMHCPLRGAYLTELIEKTARALDGVRRSDRDGRRAAELSGLLDGLQTMKREWDAWQP